MHCVCLPEAMSSDELAILKKHLELNLNCDEAAFRMQLFASLQSAIVRLRDSSLRDLRRKKASESQDGVIQAVGMKHFYTFAIVTRFMINLTE